MAHRYTLKESDNTLIHNLYAASIASLALPASVDLSVHTLPALDQGRLGTCACNSLAIIFKALLIKERVKPWIASRLFLYYNTRVNVEDIPAQDDSGVSLAGLAKAAAKYHACSESYWKYNESRYADTPSAIAYARAAKHNVQYEQVPQTLQAFKSCLAEGYPIQIGITVFESFESEAANTTGVISDPHVNSERCLGGHSIAVVGYSDDKQAFLCQNSWGSSWGLNGTCWISYTYMMDPDIGSKISFKYSYFK